jgi:hypothetical protein
MSESHSDGVIFTMTCYLDFELQERWHRVARALRSVQTLHRPDMISRWVVVNEYSAKPRQDWAFKFAAEFPHVEFVQKAAADAGQARSMNMLLERVRASGCAWWVHWEEAWFASRECLERGLDVMRNSNVSQLQMTRLNGQVSWMDTRASRRTSRVTPQGTAYTLVARGPAGEWPLYSLLPSINRVSSFDGVPDFPTDPELWPWTFESMFGQAWLDKGAVKAVLDDGPVVRDMEHVSSTQLWRNQQNSAHSQSHGDQLQGQGHGDAVTPGHKMMRKARDVVATASPYVGILLLALVSVLLLKLGAAAFRGLNKQRQKQKKTQLQ